MQPASSLFFVSARAASVYARSDVGTWSVLWHETLATVAYMPCEGVRVSRSTRKYRRAARILPLPTVPEFDGIRSKNP